MCRILDLIKEASELCHPSLSERYSIDYILFHLEKGGIIEIEEITLKLSPYSKQSGKFYIDSLVLIDGIDYKSKLIILLAQLTCLLYLNMNIVEVTFIWDFIKYLNRLQFYGERDKT